MAWDEVIEFEKNYNHDEQKSEKNSISPIY